MQVVDKRVFDAAKIVKEVCDYTFKDLSLLERALTHSSFANDQKLNVTKQESYERLEFLGDSILNLVIAERLVLIYKDMSEGNMTILRQKFTSKTPLAEKVRELGLDKCFRSLIKNPSDAIISDLIESISAAIYADASEERDFAKGYTAARHFIISLFEADVIHEENKLQKDPKSQLYEKYGEQRIAFVPIRKEGKDNEPLHFVELRIDGECVETAKASDLKSAEQLCAKHFLEKTHERIYVQEK